MQQRVCIRCQEVFELNKRARKYLLHTHYELFHEIVVLRTSQPFLTKAQVKRIGSHLRIVGTDVKHNR